MPCDAIEPDLLVVFLGVWTLALTDKVVTVAPQAGIAAAAMYLPLLWILPVVWWARRERPRRERPPTLLVLRFFQQDAQAQDLFDHIVERWRLSGNTVLIAGTDLADRTLDADDIFTFLEGRLGERFIVSPADVAPRIAAFDMTADIDGRYRVNECYCLDTTWQDALQALVSHSDVVVMDLRGFRARNAGCRYELSALAQASSELRVLVMVDDRTDRAAAREAIAGSQERFTFVEVPHFRARERREVLARLFARGMIRGARLVAPSVMGRSSKTSSIHSYGSATIGARFAEEQRRLRQVTVAFVAEGATVARGPRFVGPAQVDGGLVQSGQVALLVSGGRLSARLTNQLAAPSTWASAWRWPRQGRPLGIGTKSRRRMAFAASFDAKTSKDFAANPRSTTVRTGVPCGECGWVSGTVFDMTCPSITNADLSQSSSTLCGGEKPSACISTCRIPF